MVYFVRYILSDKFCPVHIVRFILSGYILSGIYCLVYFVRVCFVLGSFCSVYFVRCILSSIFCPVYIVRYILSRYVLSGIFCPVCFVRVYFVRYILFGYILFRYILSGYFLSWYILSDHDACHLVYILHTGSRNLDHLPKTEFWEPYQSTSIIVRFLTSIYSYLKVHYI